MITLVEYMSDFYPEEVKEGDPDYNMAMRIIDSIELGQNDCMSLEDYKKQLGVIYYDYSH